MEKIRNLFQKTNLTWVRLILFAVAAGCYAGVMAALPIAKDTSFADISVSFEWWVFFGIFIILSSQSPLDSGLKCFVFFLISQPLVYLIQVPFYVGGWSIFGYYKRWFLWTLLTFPMGFVGHFLKKDKCWGLLILAPMLLLVGGHYAVFLKTLAADFPHHLLSTVFCAATLLLYPIVSFEKKSLRRAALVLSLVILAAATVFALAGGSQNYSTDLLASGEAGAQDYFDDSYTAALADDSFGQVSIVRSEELDTYLIHAEFRKRGTTELILTSPEGRQISYSLTIQKNTFDLTPEP